MKRRSMIAMSDDDNKNLDETSSLQNHFICVCGCKFPKKGSLSKHIRTCSGKKHSLVCSWCNLKFKNRGNLVMHSYYMHGDKSCKSKQTPINFQCNVCDAKFSESLRLRYHIRKAHYNLTANTPQMEAKKINQIWFEKVLNTDLLMRIKKTGANTLVMKPLMPNPKIKIPETNDRIDLSGLYPTGRRTREETCKICNKTFKRIDLKKHLDEKHLNNFKMKCNNCNRMFKRLYIYLQHVCSSNIGKRRKRIINEVGGVTQYGNMLQIANVASLKAVEVD